MSNTTPNRIKLPSWVLNTTSTTAPSLTDPALNTAFKNQIVTTPDGTKYFVDATGVASEFTAGDTTPVTTSITPVVYDGSAFVNAQADADTNLADLVQLSDGSFLHDGKVTWTGHGLTVGSWYYLSQTAAGGYVTPAPTTGWVQQLFFVEDADTIHVDIEEGVEQDAPTGESTTSPYILTATSNVNHAMLGGFAADFCRYNVINTTQTLGGAAAAYSTSTFRFTPTRAGFYEVKARYRVWRGAASEQANLNIIKNGSAIASTGMIGAVQINDSIIVYMNGTTDWIGAVTTGNVASTQQQSAGTSMFQARWLHY